MSTRAASSAQFLQHPSASATVRSPGLAVAIAAGVLAAAAFLPSALRYILTLSSIIPGFAVTCALILGLATAGLMARMTARRVLDQVFLASLVMAAVTAHLVMTALFFPVEVGRLATSVILLGVAIITASQLSYFFAALPPALLSRALTICSAAFPIIAAFAVIGLQPPSALAQLKPMFPFTEPSHFALTFTPFLIDACARSRSFGRLGWLAIAVIIATLMQSLSLLVGVALAALVCLNARELGIAGLLVLLVAGLFLSGVDLTYYTDRLDLSEDSGNLSSLVYLQGWDLMQESLARTSGFGIGFMQLGYLPTNVPTADLIYRLAGNDLNLRDGSFTAAKLISELGVFGVGIVGYMLISVGKSVLRLRSAEIRMQDNRAEMMARSFIVGIMVDLFVRGIGYFSGTSVLFVTGIMLVRRLRVSANTSYELGEGLRS